ncbi:hypothetical protein BDQ17DRAFT_1406141 [Cyathus striatus]|nr:hypothetical protein BDQ17DRAFT_1406141 [Cyathus striatus]
MTNARASQGYRICYKVAVWMARGQRDRERIYGYITKILKWRLFIMVESRAGEEDDINVSGLKDCPFCDVSASKPADTSSTGNDVPTSIIDNNAVPDDAHQSQSLTEKKESNTSCTENANRTDTMPANAHQSQPLTVTNESITNSRDNATITDAVPRSRNVGIRIDVLIGPNSSKLRSKNIIRQRKKTSDINVSGLKNCPFCDVYAYKPAGTSSTGNDVPTSVNNAVPDDSQPLTDKKSKNCTENENNANRARRGRRPGESPVMINCVFRDYVYRQSHTHNYMIRG